jgi:hypothetical protein
MTGGQVVREIGLFMCLIDNIQTVLFSHNRKYTWCGKLTVIVYLSDYEYSIKQEESSALLDTGNLIFLRPGNG